MSLTLLAAPAEEPLTLADAKAFARIETADDDLLVQALIISARLHVEATTRRFLVTQSWRLAIASARSGLIAVPVAPVQAVIAVRLRDAAGASTALDPASYQVDLAATPPTLRLAAALPQGGRVEVDMLMGYGAAAAVPEPLRHALRLLVASWYEERGYLAMTGPDAPLPAPVERLLAPYRNLGL